MDKSRFPYAAFCCSLQRLSFQLQRRSDELLQKKLGIGFSQFKLLIALEKHPAVEQIVLAHYLGQTEASISRQIQLMSKSGLLTVHKDAQDSRKRIVRVTGQGRVLLEEAAALLDKEHQHIFETLDVAERKAMVQATQKMVDAIN